MGKVEAKKRIKKLRQLVSHHDHLYYVLDKPEISDEIYDSLINEIFSLEKEFPELIVSNSPTQRIGGQPLKEFKKTKHSFLMPSINDIFSEQDIKDWEKRISRLLTSSEIKNLDYFCELKLDGIAIELIYSKGVLEIGSTRGDGMIGEDITQNIKTVRVIPLKLRSREKIQKDLEKEGFRKIAGLFKDNYPEIIVGGEVFISKKSFEQINEQREKDGLFLYANPRNLAAGSVRQLDSKITASRNLDFIAYDLKTDLGLETHEQKHQVLKILGFKTYHSEKACKNLKQVFEFFKKVQSLRQRFGFEIDGLVVNVNSNDIFNKLGLTGRAHRGVVAYKFPLKQATTKVLDIKIQVGRTGALTPVAILKPVKIGGVTISRATLHNEDEIKRLGLKIGDTVVVGRAGDVIPDITKVLTELRNGKEKDFKVSRVCPSCGQKVVKPKSEVVWRCVNSKCFAKTKGSLYHFVSRNAFNVVGLGPKVIEQLLDVSLIQDAADLFELKQGDLVGLERFAQKSAENLILAIKNSKKVSLPRFIFSLGIRNIGEQTALDLASYFKTLENLKKADLQELENLEDIGPVGAESIYSWFRDKKNLDLVQKLFNSGVKILGVETSSGKLQGKTFVFTGSLSLGREAAKQRVRSFGGRISESISSNTDYLVVGKNSGSKLEKAQKLKTQLLFEKDFLKIIE